MQPPLSLFFCCSLRHYRRAMIPAVWVHGAFVAGAFALHAADVTDLPALVNVNNALLAAGLLYTLILCALEVRRGNRFLWISTPFLALAWGATVVDFYYFYLTRRPMRYLFLDPFFLLIAAALAHSVLVFFRQYYRERKESEVQAMQLQAALESYELEREHNERLRALKHEFNKHMAAAKLYMKTGKLEEAVAYLDRVSGDYRDLRLSAHCDNLLVNALVGRMLRRAHGMGARVELKLDDIEPVGMDDNELFGLLSNLLDNALEACAATLEGERYIHLTIRRRGPGLLVVCENSRQGLLLREGDDYRTTKPDPENHGHGLPEIRRIAGRYRGVLDIQGGSRTFRVSVLLHDMAKQPSSIS